MVDAVPVTQAAVVNFEVEQDARDFRAKATQLGVLGL
jgi:hypothetical protein